MKTHKRFIVILAMLAIAFAGIPPTIVFADGEDLIVVKRDELGIVNGSVGATEYSETGMISNGLGNFQIQTYRHPTDGTIEEEIQFFFTISDSSSNAGDEIRIFFDIDHDHSVSTQDRGIYIRRTSTDVMITNVNLTGPTSDLDSLDASQSQIDNNPGNWTAEVKLKASDLDLNFIPSLMGIFVEAKDVDAGVTTTGKYPIGAIKIDMETWANLKTRYALEYVLLLDQSGSMLRDFDGSYPPVTSERWSSAKAATDIFTQIYYAFRSDEDSASNPYFLDQIGLATYYWDDSEPSGSEDKSTEVKALDPLVDITVDGYVDSAPAPAVPVFGQHTPIKRGVNTAFEMLGSGNAEKIVILLSDGIHDRPTSNYDEYLYVFPSGTGASDFQINTVALGPDGSVGTQLLDDIKDDFSGFGGSYTSSLHKKDLIAAFAENLFSHLYLNRTEVDPAGHFIVDEREPRLLVMLVWHSTTAGERGFRILKSDSVIIDTSHPSYHHYKNAALEYEIAYYVIDFPAPSGTWQTIETGSTSPAVGDNNFALFDPTVYTFFSVAQTGEDFILKAALREDGTPITDSDTDVTVDIAKPDEGLGTYTSTAQQNCTFEITEIEGAQEYRPLSWAFREIQRFLSGLFSAKTMMTTETPKPILPTYEEGVEAQPFALPPAVRTEAAAVEPLPPHFAKVQELFQKCGKDGLDRSTITLQLYDDGTHGDEDKDDGIFTLLFDDTQHEGTYMFYFTASGTSPTGSDFSRVRTLSAHKSVAADPAQTEFVFIELYEEGYFAFTQYYVLPRDQNGEYLGPGHVSEIEFSTTGGEWQTQVLDHNNGWYSRVLRYDTRKAEPFVSPVIQGQTIYLPWLAFLYLFLLLILILLLILFWRWIRRRRSGS